jgi:hypothetical protein
MADARYLDPSWGWWVTGLADGEACFYAGLNYRSKAVKSGRQVDCVELQAEFSVTLRADDAAALLRLQEYFDGAGDMIFLKRSQAPSVKKYGLRPNPKVQYKLRRPDDLVGLVIPHFDRYPLRTKKGRDYGTWKKIVEFATSELIGRKYWLRRFPEKVDALQGMCDQLRDGRAFDESAMEFGGN